MSRKLLVLSAALFCCTALASADDKDTKKDDKTKQAKATVAASNLSIFRKLDEKQYPYSGLDSMSLNLLVTVPGKQILVIDASSKLEKFADDKDTNLIDDKAFAKTNFGLYPRVAQDRGSMLVPLYTNRAPARGASKITVKGSLVVVCGLEEKTTEAAKIEFKEKAEAKTGDLKVMVTMEKGFGNEGASFSVTTTSPNIKSVTVKDGDDKDVEVLNRGQSGFGKNWTFYFTLKKPLKDGKISVTYFSKDEKVTVPVDLSFGVGL